MKNIKYLSIILLVGFVLLNFISVSYADTLACPANSKPTTGFTNFSEAYKQTIIEGLKAIGALGGISTPSVGNVIKAGQEIEYCTRPAQSQSDCIAENGEIAVQEKSGNWICSVKPVTLTKTNEQLCAAANTYPLQNNSCNIGDLKVNCVNGVICARGSGSVGGHVNYYNLSYPIPCDPSLGSCPSAQTPAGYIARLYQFGLMIAGLAAFGSIVYGALKYVLSAGNVGTQQDAKDQITQAILGLVLLLGAYLILYTINPNLVNLTNPNLEPINIQGIIQSAQPDNTGEQRLTTGGGGSAGDLCATSINANIGVSATNIPGVTSGEKTSGPLCLNCVDNAHREGAVLGVGGTCVCDAAYKQSGNSCVYSANTSGGNSGPVGTGKEVTCPPGYVVSSADGITCLISCPTNIPALKDKCIAP